MGSLRCCNVGGNRRVEREVFRVFVLAKGRGELIQGKPGMRQNDSAWNEQILTMRRGNDPREMSPEDRGCLRAHWSTVSRPFCHRVF